MTKIAVPSDDRTTVTPHFGRTAGFLVFDYDGTTMKSEYREVAAARESDGESCCGGNGQSHHERIVKTIGDCDVVIAGGMGGPMMNALYLAGIEVALSTVADARKAAEMLVEDILPKSTGSGCCTH